MHHNLLITAKEFIVSSNFSPLKEDILFLYAKENEALEGIKKLAFFVPKLPVYYLPGFDCTPYDRISPSQEILAKRAKLLTSLAQSDSKKILVTHVSNLLHKFPPKQQLLDAFKQFKRGFKISITDLCNFLVENGFNRTSNCIEIGDFAVRGEIVDLVTSAQVGYRIYFSWDKIESIKIFDLNTQISSMDVDSLDLYPSNEIILNDETIGNFKQNYIRHFGLKYTQEPLYNAINSKIKFPGFESLLPLYYPQLEPLTSYLDNPQIIFDNLCLQALNEYESGYLDFYNSRKESNNNKMASFFPVLPVNELLFSSQEINEQLKSPSNILLTEASLTEDLKPFDNINVSSLLEKKSPFDKLIEVLQDFKTKIPLIFCPSRSGYERLKAYLSQENYLINDAESLQEIKAGYLNFVRLALPKSFLTKKYLLIAEQEIVGEKYILPSRERSKRKLKNILFELDNIEEGQLIVHQDHGIGKFLTVETILVNNQPHDCLKILYARNDKLYLPVENIQLIKKYGDEEVELDYLGSVGWQKRKAKLKNRITDLAAKLMEIAAKRKLQVADITDYDQEAYQEFCNEFKYSETDDQLNAIEDIKSDLTSGILMDRLICGDVGFGKTEVAMRAAFMVVKDQHIVNPQIAVIVPTTILSKQHYNSFLTRFQKFNVKIVHLSRLITPIEAKKVKEEIANGRAQIIIGTHALLAKTIKFSNLKLIIIDEEQRFGVEQKENLKALVAVGSKSHVLALSATPIPRTLQMSLLGIKELSLIATPPVDRMPIRTSVIMFDPVVIRDALMREYFRGGKSFYICPRIKDLAELETKLLYMVPELKYKIVHGQMPAVKVDTIMNDFDDGKFDILVSTTIIESGIDIPTANTIIIHKADTLGLSQLYQLRGRVGRAKIRGYAYLTLSANKVSSKHAVKRLEIMQNADSLGIGFTIASHDMDLRGFGNLVGEEQSGNVREVGVELYQEMLEEAMNKVKVSDIEVKPNSSINLSLPIFISKEYIEDASLRLAIYRRAGNLNSTEEVIAFQNEMIDRFGPMPTEFQNLLNTILIKQLCNKLHIESLDSGPLGFVVKFGEHKAVANMVLNFTQKYPRHCKIKPENKLVYLTNLEKVDIIKAANNLLEQLQVFYN